MMNTASEQMGKGSVPPLPAKKRKAALWILIAFCLGLLLGYIPELLTANQRQLELDQSHKRLSVASMHLDLAEAALNARRAKYEVAREELSRFFTSFQRVSDRTTDGSLGDPQKIQQLLKQRDELITLLARSDPGSADRLSNLEEEFSKDVRLK